MDQELRRRDVPHFWGDKRVLRFLRKNVDGWFSVISVYHALCEMDSDFVQARDQGTSQLHNVVRTCSAYSGLGIGTARAALQILRKCGLIDYGPMKDGSNFIIGSYFNLYKFMGDEYHASCQGEATPRLLDGGSILKNNSLYKELNHSTNGSRGAGEGRPNDASSSDQNRPSPVSKRRGRSLVSFDYQQEPAYQLIVFWDTLAGLRHHLKDRATFKYWKSKTFDKDYASIQDVLAGTYFNDIPRYVKYHGHLFTFEELKQSFVSLSLSAQKDYTPPNKKLKARVSHLSIADFFYDWHNLNPESHFIRLLETPPQPIGQPGYRSSRIDNRVTPDPQDLVRQKIIRVFKLFWTTKVLGNSIQPQYSVHDFQRLNSSADSVLAFHSRVKRKLAMGMQIGPVALARLVTQALEQEHEENLSFLELGHFCSPRTYNKVLPKYMADQGFFETQS